MRNRLALVLATTLAACGAEPSQAPATDASTAADSNASANWSGTYAGDWMLTARDAVPSQPSINAGGRLPEVAVFTNDSVRLSVAFPGCVARFVVDGPTTARLSATTCTATNWSGPYATARFTLRSGTITRSAAGVALTSEWDFEGLIAPRNPNEGMTQRSVLTLRFDLTR